MIYLGEREVGFDQQAIGFPSIDGCHAVVLDTEAGLYGFHNYGGSGVASFEERGTTFAKFVTQHFVSRGLSKGLYGVCFRNKRGYADSDKRKAWKAEMKAFATALGYSGKVRGYDLGLTGIGAHSAYVECRKTPHGVSIHCKAWHEMNHTKGPNSDRANHRTTVVGDVKTQTAQIYDTITAGGGPAIIDVDAGHLDSFSA